MSDCVWLRYQSVKDCLHRPSGLLYLHALVGPEELAYMGARRWTWGIDYPIMVRAHQADLKRLC